MRVFRYEHPKTGYGPFVNPYEMLDATEEWIEYDDFISRENGLGSHNNVNTHPTPFDTLNHRIRMDEVCGCDTLDALMRWFDNLHDELEAYGFELVELEVPTWRVVGPDKFGQVVFPKRHARRVS